MAKRLSTDEIQLNITINSNKAKLELGELDRRAVKLRDEMKGLKKGTEEYAAKSRELAQVKARMDELRNQVGLTALSMRQLAQRARELGLIKQHLTPGTAEFKKVDAELQKVNARMRELRTGSQQTGVSLKGMASGFNRYFGIITAFTASILGSVMGFRKLVEQFNEYEQAVANLSSLTGLAGEQLVWLSEQAKQLSTTTTEEGIRLKSSAKDIVDAYRLIGSQRPELLQNREDLNAVTREALILAEAAQMELDPAARAVTTTMNQFNLSASEARRVINALGAGSKIGAADIPYLNDAIEKTGTSARGAGLSVEQLIATIEGIAPKFAQPSEAGTSLRNVLLRLQAGADDTNPAIVGLETALDNLAAKQYSAAELTQLFGLRAMNMANALIEGRGDIARFTEAVTDSNIAVEQAIINTDTNAAKLEQARNKAALLRMELGEKLAPALTFSTNAFSYLVKAIMHLIDNWDLYRRLLIATLAVLAVYNAATILAIVNKTRLNAISILENSILAIQAVRKKAATAATLLYAAAHATLSGNITRANAAMRMLRMTMAGFPWGAALAAITAIASALLIYYQRKKDISELEKSQLRMQEELNEQHDLQASKIQILSGIIERSNVPLEKRRDAINQMKEIMPEYNGYLDEEGTLHGHNTDQINKYLEALKERIALQILEEELVSLARRHLQATREVEQAKKDLLVVEREYYNAVARAEENRNMTNADAEEGARQRFGAQKARHQSELDNLDEINNAYTALEIEYNRLVQTMVFGSKSSTDAQDDLNDAFAEGNDILKEATSAYDELNKKISEAQKHLANYVTLGDLTSAQAWHNILRGLMAQKYVLDQLIAAGGDMTKMLDDFREAQYKAGESIIDSIDKDIDQLLSAEFKSLSDEAKAATEETRKARLEGYNEEVKQQLALKGAWFDASLDIANTLANATADIYSNQLQAQADAQIAALNRRRDVELNNENLTAEQRDKINEKYRKQEARIKEDAFRKQKAADIILSIINTGLAVTRAMAAPPGWPANLPQVIAAGIAGAAQTAVIASQKVPQFAKGRYNVIGQDDNKLYKDVPFMGPARTGIYNNALVGEKGDELIIDNPTLRNIRVNFPEVMQAIHAARVQQHAQGRYQPATSNPTESSRPVGVSSTDPALLAALNRLNNHLDAGLEAHLVYQKLRKFEDKVTETLNQNEM